MPFYEYECQACGKHHEALQKMGDPPLRKCPNCAKSKLKRLISAPVFRLKGGGWYETDFKSDQDKKRNLHADEPKSDTSSAAETKTVAAPPATEAKAPAAAPAAAPSAKSTAKSTAKASAKAPVKPVRKAPAKAARRR